MGTHLPRDLYRLILEAVPIVCVDVIIRRDPQVLLVKRANEPLKGVWWVPGGRVLKNETLIDAARRKVKDEVGLTLTGISFVGVYEDQYETSSLEVPCHCVSMVFEAMGHGNIIPNSEVTHWAWAYNLPSRFMEKLTWK